LSHLNSLNTNKDHNIVVLFWLGDESSTVKSFFLLRADGMETTHRPHCHM